jgi:hypothetical protein
MSEKDRRTNGTEAPSDLSRRVRAYYADCVSTEAEREEFERLATAVWGDLLEAEQSGADGGFLLHVLVCTKFRRATPNIARSETLQRLNPRKRAALLAGLRAIRELKQSGLEEIFGPQGHDWAHKIYEGIEYLQQQLTGGGTVETPAFQTLSRANVSRRHTEQAVTACVVCLMDQLKGHPKPAAAVAILLEKFGLLGRSSSGLTAMEFVKKRASRAAVQARDKLGPIGNPIWMLRQSYEGLKEFLYSTPASPDISPS